MTNAIKSEHMPLKLTAPIFFIFVLFCIAFSLKTRASFAVFYWISTILYFCIFFFGIKIKFNDVCDSIIYKFIFFLYALIVACMCVLPMNLSPHYNGEIKNFCDQYEHLADAIIEGHFHLNYQVDPILQKMKNPYDRKKRDELKVKYHWDHAFYRGKYYSYFGIVPAILVFVPYKLMTNKTLTSYHATQLFVSLSILGLFYIFWLLSKYIHSNISFIICIYYATSLSILSIFFAITKPTLYCTAISAGIFFELLSIICFFCFAIYKKSYLLLIASFSGALTFGCRPPIAMANVIVLPFCFAFFFKKNIKNILYIILPYVFVLSFLMYYNYIRFDNFFEFGQSYQLTIIDQSKYMSNISERIFNHNVFSELYAYFFSTDELGKEWWGTFMFGTFINFPILFLFFYFFSKKIFIALDKIKVYYLFLFLCISVIVTAFITVVGAPFVLERYHMDTYFSIAIISFCSILVLYKSNNKYCKNFLAIFSLIINYATIIRCFFYSIKPHDNSFTQFYVNYIDGFDAVIWFNFF